MAGEPMDNQTLLRRTLITVGAMVGGSVLILGTLTLVASSVAARAVGDGEAGSSASASASASGAVVPRKIDMRSKSR